MDSGNYIVHDIKQYIFFQSLAIVWHLIQIIVYILKMNPVESYYVNSLHQWRTSATWFWPFWISLFISKKCNYSLKCSMFLILNLIYLHQRCNLIKISLCTENYLNSTCHLNHHWVANKIRISILVPWSCDLGNNLVYFYILIFFIKIRHIIEYINKFYTYWQIHSDEALLQHK